MWWWWGGGVHVYCYKILEIVNCVWCVVEYLDVEPFLGYIRMWLWCILQHSWDIRDHKSERPFKHKYKLLCKIYYLNVCKTQNIFNIKQRLLFTFFITSYHQYITLYDLQTHELDVVLNYKIIIVMYVFCIAWMMVDEKQV